MRIDLTVAGPGGQRDVRVLTPPDAPARDVLDALASVAGVAPGTAWHCGARVVDPGVPLTVSGVCDGVVLSGDEAPSTRRSGTLALHVVGGPDSGRAVPLGAGRFTIGRSESCDVTLHDDGVSREHLELRLTAGDATVRDLGSTNGVQVDGTPCPGERAIRPGELVRVGETLLTLATPPDARGGAVDRGGRVRIAPAPRSTGALPAIVLDRPPAPRHPGRGRWLIWLAPLAAAGVAAWLTHSPLFLLLAVLSPVIALAGGHDDGWSRRRTRTLHARALAAHERAVSAVLVAEAGARRARLPDAAAVVSAATSRSGHVWQRGPADPDHLAVRVGTATMPSAAGVRDGAEVTPAGLLADVPLGVDLAAGPVALVGPVSATAALVRWVVTQLAVFHSPGRLELVLLLGAGTSARWAWARWLPHLRGRVATTAEQRRALVSDLAAEAPDAATVVVVDVGPEAARGLDPALVTAGRTAVWVGAADPPTWCRTVARVCGDAGTAVRVSTPDAVAVTAVLDQVTVPWAAEVARALAPLEDSAGGGRPPGGSPHLLESLGIPAVDPAVIAATWARSTGGLDTVLGRTADGPLHLDLDADGPHALVAGTTGSGKSHLLRMLVAGLAVLHPPEEVTFLLVDYKGGAAFAECVRLPHTTGVVTDLDPHLVRRALASLEAELTRRERAFAAARVQDLAGYRRASGVEPLPRLVIVVDEFAAMADELPDFVRDLVSVARRGRALGVHLVLATQRPGTAVTAEIRANTDLRIALRVTGSAESVDVIDAPDAATIPRGAPGRAYLRRGGDLVAFRTVMTDLRDPARVQVVPLDGWRRPAGGHIGTAADGLADLVDVIARTAADTGRPAVRRPWCPPLPTDVPASTLPGAAVGLLDRPEIQAQPPLGLEGSSVLLVGAPGAGRTTALATIGMTAASAHSPRELALYAVDTSGALVRELAGLPHLAACLGPDSLDVVPTLLRRLCATSAVPAQRVLLVDGYDTLLARDDTGTIAAGVAELVRGGAAADVTVVVSGGRTLLGPATAGVFATRLVLALADRADFALAGIPTRAVPSAFPPGRGVRAGDTAEFQLARPDAALRAASREWADALPVATPRVRSLPPSVRLDVLPRSGRCAVLGVGRDDATPVELDLYGAAPVRLLVAGPPRSGRSTTLLTLLVEVVRLGLHPVVAAPPGSPLGVAAARVGAALLRLDDDPGAPPGDGPILLLVDDAEEFVDTPAADGLTRWLTRSGVSAALAVRSDDAVAAHRGLVAEIRRNRRGVLLDPGPLDGDLLGVRLPRTRRISRPGRGVLVGFDGADAVPIQVAQSC